MILSRVTNMNLTEWKQKQISEERERIKGLIREESDIDTWFSEEDLEELREEVLFEDFSEDIFFEGEYDLSPIDLEEGCVFEHTFVPDQFGEKMDIEVEFDLTENELSLPLIGKMRDAFFAEDYEVEVDEDKAKVVFTRAGGKISKKKKCKKGTKLKGNKCIPQSGSDKAGNRMLGIKLKRAKKTIGAGAKKKAAIKAKVTKKRIAGRSRGFGGTTN